jgi:clan AA aspartic protease (TIGR02281 family)
MIATLLLLALTLVALAGSAPAGAQTVKIQARSYNMFYADVILNNRIKVRALIDTGATYLSMCATTATKLGLVLGEEVRLHTANGIITSHKTMVQSVRIGDIEVRNVAATVDARPSCDKGVLVGMTVLSKLHMTVDKDRLILAARGIDAAEKGVWWLLGGVWSVLLLSLMVVRQPCRNLRQLRLLRRDGVAMQTFAGRSFFD